MRNSFALQLVRTVRSAVACALGCLTLCAFFLTPPKAEAQVTPTSMKAITNLPPVWATALSTNVNAWIPIHQDRNLVLQTIFALSGSGVDPQIYWLYPSMDGTNVATANPLGIWSVPSTGTTGVIGTTNIPKAVLEGYQYVVLTVASNASARNVFHTNLLYGYRN